MSSNINQNFEMVEGSTFSLEFEFTEDDVVVDITGADIFMTWKVSPSDDDPGALQVTGTLTDPTNGKFKIDLAPGDTTGLAALDYNYDVKIIESGGRITFPLIGKFKLIQRITDAT